MFDYDYEFTSAMGHKPKSWDGMRHNDMHEKQRSLIRTNWANTYAPFRQTEMKTVKKLKTNIWTMKSMAEYSTADLFTYHGIPFFQSKYVKKCMGVDGFAVKWHVLDWPERNRCISSERKCLDHGEGRCMYSNVTFQYVLLARAQQCKSGLKTGGSWVRV